MGCKLCHEDISPDCMLTIGICVFCWYDTDYWESNAQPLTRDEALWDNIMRRGTSARLTKAKKRVPVPKNIRYILDHILNCTILAIARDTPASTVDVGMLAKVVKAFRFLVLRIDVAGATGPEEVARRLSGAIGTEYTDLDLVMQMYVNLQAKRKLCVIVENFEAIVRLERRKARYIEGIIRRYAQAASRASWVFLGTRDMLDAFVLDDRSFFLTGVLLFEGDIDRPARGV
jgi:hypothetical protein